MLGAGWYTVIYSMKLCYYLMDKHPDQWSELTTIGSTWGPGMSNPFRWLPYIYDDTDCEDAKVRYYKERTRLGIRWALFMLTLLALAIILIVVGMATGLLR